MTIGRRYTDVPFAAILATVGVNAALSFIVAPQRQPAHMLLAPWDAVWAAMYGLGGLLILAGIGSARANIESAGCLAFGGGALISAVASAAVLGRPAWNTVIVLALFCVGAVIRAVHLARGQVLVLLSVDAVRKVEGRRR